MAASSPLSLDSLSIDSKPRLLPELLPKVLRHLDPKKDITTLLTVQRCSDTGWNAATPIIYQKVSIKDCTKFLYLPLPPPVPRIKKLDHILPGSAYAQAVRRRWKTMRFVEDATFTVFPTGYASKRMQELVAFVLVWCKDLDDDARTRSQPFLSLKILRISAEAWKPFAYGTDAEALATKYRKNADNAPTPLHVTEIAQPLNYCITLPFCREETALYQYAHEMQDPDLTTVEPPLQRSEIHDLLAMLLASIRNGAHISIHNMLDRWGCLAWTKRSHTYRLFYPRVRMPKTVNIDIVQMRNFTDRMNGYIEVLKESRERAAAKDAGPLEGMAETMRLAYQKLNARGPPLFGPKPLSTWRTTGEGRFAGNLAGQRQYTKMIIDNLVTCCQSWSPDEKVLVGEPWLVDRSPNEVVGKDKDGRDATLKRLVVEAPGNETSCKFCGCA